MLLQLKTVYIMLRRFILSVILEIKLCQAKRNSLTYGVKPPLSSVSYGELNDS